MSGSSGIDKHKSIIDIASVFTTLHPKKESLSKIYTFIVILLAGFIIIGCGEQKTHRHKNQHQSNPVVAAIKTIDSMYVASMSKIGPYAESGKLWEELSDWLNDNKVKPAGVPFGIYYDDPTKVKSESTKKIDIPVPAGTKGDKNSISIRQVPAESLKTEIAFPFKLKNKGW